MFSIRQTLEGGRTRTQVESVPNVTVTSGHITNITKGIRQQDGAVTRGTLGASYQLDVVATGAGNSGGPVFDETGRAIGLFTYSSSRGLERVTHAVPISLGRNLLNPRNVN